MSEKTIRRGRKIEVRGIRLKNRNGVKNEKY